MSTGAIVVILVISHAAAFVLGGLVFRAIVFRFGRYLTGKTILEKNDLVNNKDLFPFGEKDQKDKFGKIEQAARK